jgi:phosphatidylglycerol:prolipoprotein diacylglycerol transferase
MYPKLVEFGMINVYSYGVVVAVAYLLALQLAISRGRKRGLNPTRLMDLSLWAFVGGLVGARLLLLLVNIDSFLYAPERLWALARSAGVFYGGFLLAVVLAVWYMRRHTMPVWTTCDAFAPPIALGQAVGRLGCLLAGCCYGQPTDLPFAIQFTSTLAADTAGTPLYVNLHPTQLYEAAAVFFVFCFLLIIERRGHSFAGRSFLLYLLAYSIARFFIEFFRGDPRGDVFGVVSTSQFISLLLFFAAAVAFLLRAAGRLAEQAGVKGSQSA